jgi:hypothetical protein
MTITNETSCFTFARVDPETLEVTLKYNTNGGVKWADDDLECLIAFDVLADTATKDSEGNVTLLEDPTKVQAKTDQAWLDVRAQQKQQLYESDWTCSVTDYEVPNKADWAAYRQALRDVTTQTDPFAIVWPVAPSE